MVAPQIAKFFRPFQEASFPALLLLGRRGQISMLVEDVASHVGCLRSFPNPLLVWFGAPAPTKDGASLAGNVSLRASSMRRSRRSVARSSSFWFIGTEPLGASIGSIQPIYVSDYSEPPRSTLPRSVQAWATTRAAAQRIYRMYWAWCLLDEAAISLVCALDQTGSPFERKLRDEIFLPCRRWSLHS